MKHDRPRKIVAILGLIFYLWWGMLPFVYGAVASSDLTKYKPIGDSKCLPGFVEIIGFNERHCVWAPLPLKYSNIHALKTLDATGNCASGYVKSRLSGMSFDVCVLREESSAPKFNINAPAPEDSTRYTVPPVITTGLPSTLTVNPRTHCPDGYRCAPNQPCPSGYYPIVRSKSITECLLSEAPSGANVQISGSPGFIPLDATGQCPTGYTKLSTGCLPTPPGAPVAGRNLAGASSGAGSGLSTDTTGTGGGSGGTASGNTGVGISDLNRTGNKSSTGSSGSVFDYGTVAAQVTKNLPDLARLLTSGAYVAGFAFGLAAILKFKAHKENPTQVHLSQSIALLFVSAALIFIPSVFLVTGGTLFGTQQSQAGITGIESFKDAGKT